MNTPQSKDHRFTFAELTLANWPTENGRFRCTLSMPMPVGAAGLWVHADYADHGDGMCAQGCCDKYICRACGTRFTVEGAD